MSNTYLDKAIEAVPELGNRISLFTKKLRLAQYADSTIYSYRLKISQAVLYLKKLPDDFTQPDVDDYLTMLLTGSVCGMLIFVDKSAVPLCTIFAMSCIIIDQF